MRSPTDTDAGSRRAHGSRRRGRPDAGPDEDEPAPGGGAGHAAAGDEPAAPVQAVQGLLGAIDRWQRRHRGTAFAFGVVKKFGDDRAGALAALVAYYSFFSLFPLLLVLVTLLGFALSGNQELQGDIVDSALTQYPVLGDQIQDNVGELDGSWLALTIGVVGTLWAGLGALQTLQDAMNTVWDLPVRVWPGFLVKRARALGMLVLFGAGIVVSTVVTGIGVVGSLGIGALQPVLALALSATINTSVFVAAFLLLTNTKLGWRDVLPGAALAGVGWVALQSLGSWFIGTRMQGASEVYGTFAVVIVLLSWLYLQAQLLLLAAEVNVVRTKRLWPRSLTGEDLTDEDHRALSLQVLAAQRRPEQAVEVGYGTASGGDGDGDGDGDRTEHDREP